MNDENVGALNALLQIEKTVQKELKKITSDTLSKQSNLQRKICSLLNTNEQYIKQLEDVYNRSSE